MTGDPFGGQSFGDPFGSGGFPGGPPIYSAPPPPPAAPQTNTLATLSVVFAVVFAPAGAVLGHLGLSQIKRTGQRGRDRAIVGIALSYSIIVIAVIALVVWSVTADDAAGPSVTATPSRTSAATTTTTTTPTSSNVPPPATDADYPQPTLVPGRTMTAAELPSLLLDLDEVKAIMAKPGGDSATPALSAQPAVTNPIPFPGPQGTVTPEDCTSVFTSGSASAYQDLGYQALYSISMTEPRSYGEQIVVQTATVYDSPDAAVAALTNYLNKAWQCRDRPDNPGRSNMTFDVVDPGGGAKQMWNSVGVLGRYGNYYISSCQRHLDNMAPGSAYTISRSWIAKGNVLLDVSVRGAGLDGPAQYMIMALEKKL